MGIENLMQGDAGWRIDNVRRTESDRGYSRSPLFIVSTAYIQEGRDGMLTISNKLARDDIAIVPDQRLIDGLPQVDKHSANINQAAILLGISGVAVDTMMTQKVFSEREWINSYNDAIRGTILPTLTPINPEDKQISDEDWMKMIECFRVDPTLASLFGENFGKLPSALAMPLRDTGALSAIQGILLPQFKSQIAEQIDSRRREQESIK